MEKTFHRLKSLIPQNHSTLRILCGASLPPLMVPSTLLPFVRSFASEGSGAAADGGDFRPVDFLGV